MDDDSSAVVRRYTVLYPSKEQLRTLLDNARYYPADTIPLVLAECGSEVVLRTGLRLVWMNHDSDAIRSFGYTPTGETINLRIPYGDAQAAVNLPAAYAPR